MQSLQRGARSQATLFHQRLQRPSSATVRCQTETRVHLRQFRICGCLTATAPAGCKVKAVDPTSKKRLNNKIGVVGDFDANAGLWTVAFNSKEVKMRPGEMAIVAFSNEKVVIENGSFRINVGFIFQCAGKTSGWTRQKAQAGPLAGKSPKLYPLMHAASRDFSHPHFSPPGLMDGKPAIMIYGVPQLFTKSDKQQAVAAIEAMGIIPGDVLFSDQAYQSNLSQGQQDEVDKARRMCDAVDKLLADGKPAKALTMAQKALLKHQRIFKPDHWDMPW